MNLFGVNSWEFLILIVLAMMVIGPDKLPQYIAKAREGVTKVRSMADGAKSQLKEQIGPEYEDINWRQYDPRQYDPRTIVRQALFDQPGDQAEAPEHPASAVMTEEPGQVQVPPVPEPAYPARYDPDRATPWDNDAT